MSTSNAKTSPASSILRARILQVAGLVGANHVLTRLAPHVLPGAGASRIDADWALFGDAAAADLGRAILTLAILPGVLEELIFRGLLFALVRQLAGARWAIGVSAVAFGAVHLDLHLSTIAALLGLQLGCLRQVHGLGVAIAAHVVNNAGVLLLRLQIEAAPAALPERAAGALSIASFLVALGLAGIAWASLAQSMRSESAAATPAMGRVDRTTADP